MTEEEYAYLIDRLGRVPNRLEEGMVSALWSEHCCYKSSKKWLRLLPKDAPWVICHTGENAGVVSVGDGQAVVFKIESHNHPSMIEPYQGAATGVGGILRDIFTMGARPIASLNTLRFGDPLHPRTPYLVSRVVQGIGDYGNCVGIPTVGGEVGFHDAYNGNILVNAMTVGVVQEDCLLRSAAVGVGNLVVYIGARTGCDGVHGATMASAELSTAGQDNRPTVQIGDPFVERLLLEACLELASREVIVAIQDMGAAGLTSSVIEMAGKGGYGVWMDLDCVPIRQEDMSAYDIMLSESQERMVLVVVPEHEGIVREVCEKWGLVFSVIGSLTNDLRVTLVKDDVVQADLPLSLLIDEAPVYDRPWRTVVVGTEVGSCTPITLQDVGFVLKRLLGSSDLCSKRWVWEQYDSQVGGDTIFGPGVADSAVVRIHGTDKALAMTIDCNERYCGADPVVGGCLAVVEAWRNLRAVGAEPLALTNNLNFGNPEKPEVMGQLVGCIQGMVEACLALNFPVISGNVSLYNETDSQAILPTPTIGGVGLITDARRATSLAFKAQGETILLFGKTYGHLGQSVYLRVFYDCEQGSVPPVDLEMERRTGIFIHSLLTKRLLTACHDVSEGGILVALAEMALVSDLGMCLAEPPEGLGMLEFCFGEDTGRYIGTTTEPQAIFTLAHQEKIPVHQMGTVWGTDICFGTQSVVSLHDLRTAHESFFSHLVKTEAYSYKKRKESL